MAARGKGRSNFNRILAENPMLYAVSPRWSEDQVELSCITMREYELTLALDSDAANAFMAFVLVKDGPKPADITRCPTRQGVGAYYGVHEVPADHYDNRTLGEVVAASSWPAPVFDIVVAWFDDRFTGDLRAMRRFSEALVLKGRSTVEVERILERFRSGRFAA